MRKTIFILLGMLLIQLCHAQTFDAKILANQNLQNLLQTISSDAKINADSAWSVLSAINEYPSIAGTGKEYLFFYTDTVFGEVPVRVFIPANYSAKTPNELILLFHGAEGQTRFSNVDKATMQYKVNGVDYTADGFYEYLCQQNFIIVRPIADVTKKFSWASNRFKTIPNPTFNTLANILIKIKKFLNIDDNKVFAFGHSDGSDGAFAMNMYKPSFFAGFVGYNATLTHILGQVYLRNMLNKPFYLVHSDLDDIRPIQQTRLQIKLLDSIKAPVLYKEYIGYKHEDKHLEIDRPYSLRFLNSHTRNPFPKEIYWETDNASFNNCDWLRILSLDTAQPKAEWHTELNSISYGKIKKEYEDRPYYNNRNKSGAVKAYYDNNHFALQTSGVGELELLISPVMVNLQNPVTVTINGKMVFDKKIDADKSFLLKKFSTDFDRQALWVASILLKVE